MNFTEFIEPEPRIIVGEAFIRKGESGRHIHVGDVVKNADGSMQIYTDAYPLAGQPLILDFNEAQPKCICGVAALITDDGTQRVKFHIAEISLEGCRGEVRFFGTPLFRSSLIFCYEQKLQKFTIDGNQGETIVDNDDMAHTTELPNVRNTKRSSIRQDLNQNTDQVEHHKYHERPVEGKNGFENWMSLVFEV